MPGLFFYNYQHCNHSSLLRGKTYEGIKNGDLDLFASIHFPLAREDPRDVPFIVQPTEASIHFLLRGKTSVSYIFNNPFSLQSASLLRGKTYAYNTTTTEGALQSTSLLRGKTLPYVDYNEYSDASIHFPLAREDSTSHIETSLRIASIHFPLAREDTLIRHGRQILIASIHFPLAREDKNSKCYCDNT